MAIFNEILVGRFGQFATRLLGIKGPNPAPSLAPEVQLSIDLLEPPDEDRFLLDERLCVASVICTAHAATFDSVRLRNPLGSNVLAILTRATISNPTATIVTVNGAYGAIGTDLAQLPTASSVGFRDGRLQGNPALKFTWDNNSAPVLPGVMLGVFQLPVNSLVDLAEAVVIPPGFAVEFSIPGNVNLTFAVHYEWRERAAVFGELG